MWVNGQHTRVYSRIQSETCPSAQKSEYGYVCYILSISICERPALIGVANAPAVIMYAHSRAGRILLVDGVARVEIHFKYLLSIMAKNTESEWEKCVYNTISRWHGIHACISLCIEYGMIYLKRATAWWWCWYMHKTHICQCKRYITVIWRLRSSIPQMDMFARIRVDRIFLWPCTTHTHSRAHRAGDRVPFTWLPFCRSRWMGK